MSIYVEIRVRGSLEELWRRTQQPELHERWDLPFSEIVYLPRPHEAAPQQFSYATRIGFGLRIPEEGESEGSRASATGERVSALTFWSRDAAGARSSAIEAPSTWSGGRRRPVRRPRPSFPCAKNSGNERRRMRPGAEKGRFE